MKCIIYDDNLSHDQKFLRKGLELNQEIKAEGFEGSQFDFAFGVGEGQLLALHLAGAYSDHSILALAQARREAIDQAADPSLVTALVTTPRMDDLLELVSSLSDQDNLLNVVDHFSKEDILLSGKKRILDKVCASMPEIGCRLLYENQALHMIYAKAAIAHYAETLREHEIFPLDFPVINTRNMQLIEHHELAQELLDSLTLPQNFMSAIRFASMLGVDDFTIVSNETLDLEKIILKTLPQAKINQIAFIEISLADMEFIE